MKRLLYILSILIIVISITGCKKDKQEQKEENICANKYNASILFEGPGGHSNGNYGRVNTIHAAGSAIDALYMSENAPQNVVYNIHYFKGGNSVNSIAYSTQVEIEACSSDSAKLEEFKTFLKTTLDNAVKAENDFRNVKAEEKDKNGTRLDVRYTITEN